MVQTVDKPSLEIRHIGDNASFLLLRHSANSGRLGLDISSARVSGRAAQNMKAFEILGFADYAGLNYWDAGQLDITNLNLTGMGIWTRYNQKARTIATHLYVPEKSACRDLSRYIFDGIRQQCDALGRKQIDILYLVAEQYENIQAVSGQLVQAVQCGMVKSFGHSAFTVEQAMQMVQESAVTLLHLQLNEVKLPELLKIIAYANYARIGVVLVLTDAVVQCIYQYGLKNQVDSKNRELLEGLKLGYLPSLRHLLDDNPCLLKVVPPKANVDVLKRMMSLL